MRRPIHGIAGMLLALSLAIVGQAREWNDVTGKHQREADFVAYRDGRVWLRHNDKNLSIAWNNLSAKDQAYIAQLEDQQKSADPFRTASTSEVTFLQTALQTRDSNEEPLPDGGQVKLVSAAMQLSEGLAFNPSGAATKPFKYVYYARCSTTHLMNFGPKQGIGTVHYCLRRHSHPCEPSCRWYLALLFKINQDSKFFYYRALFGDPRIDMWAYARRPDCCDCEYSIWIHTSKGWRQADCATRVRPK